MGITELDADDVAQAVLAWNPGPCLSEARCQASLLKWLQGRFPRSAFMPEYPIGEGRADIYAEFTDGAKVIIELKYNLTDRNEYLRLLGQLQEYVGMSNAEIVVVLCGETKNEWRAAVSSRLGELVRNRWFFKALVVEKPISARGRDGRFLPA